MLCRGRRYLQLGLTKTNSSLQERVRIVLFTLGKGNFVHLETIVRHVSRPRLPKEKREAIAVITDANGPDPLCLGAFRTLKFRSSKIAMPVQARVLKILDRFKTLGLVAFELEEDSKPRKIGTRSNSVSVFCRVVSLAYAQPECGLWGATASAATVAILRTPVLRGFGTGQEVEGHEQTALDFAPGDFVEILTSSNDWEIAQVNDVVEVPWHQLR